ncbi:helix-turn-helix domain-containing protein [Vibrio ostreicida]|uniref:Helix-turn-helix transcriptional regulator n=1 Tax=Vibrio ostreicida TaxID=526588 RepID=A0ABT8BP49_9VIBR|nr:helix-turn-helix transcriptional regulator [Vibrio ostreicida]MDN3608226.1 helix-turn-helix transcriptional regulator [Vibrio ostreicida]NPD09787.1 helix-turn-helix transcriptional regulator [Vibrio ostreicida]
MKNNSERISILRENIQFGLYQHKETKASLSRKTGITRATIYKILDGKVDRVQNSTVERIANFFGTTCYIIQNESLEEHTLRASAVCLDGNKNPIAVPVLNEKEFIEKRDHYIGALVVEYPITYHFSEGDNVVAVRVEEILSNYYTRGNCLIIDRVNHEEKGLKRLVLRKDVLHVLALYDGLESDDFLLGSIIEERYRV